jgi:hypothetical protein
VATGAPYVLSLTWPASAVSHLPMAMDVQPGPLAEVLDQTGPQRRCRCHRRAAGGGPGLALSAGGNPDASYSWRGSAGALPFARACSAGPPPEWRIASVTRLRRSRGHRTERGLTAGRHCCGHRLGAPAATLRGPNRLGSGPPSLSGQWPTHVRQEERERARSRPGPSDSSTRTRTRAPGGLGHSAITVRVSVPVQVTALGPRTSMVSSPRREPASGLGPCPLTPATGVKCQPP